VKLSVFSSQTSLLTSNPPCESYFTKELLCISLFILGLFKSNPYKIPPTGPETAVANTAPAKLTTVIAPDSKSISAISFFFSSTTHLVATSSTLSFVKTASISRLR